MLQSQQVKRRQLQHVPRWQQPSTSTKIVPAADNNVKDIIIWHSISLSVSLVVIIRHKSREILLMIIKIKISEPKTLSESKGRKAPPFNRNKQRNKETNNTEEYLQPKPTVNHRKTENKIPHRLFHYCECETVTPTGCFQVLSLFDSASKKATHPLELKHQTKAPRSRVYAPKVREVLGNGMAFCTASLVLNEKTY